MLQHAGDIPKEILIVRTGWAYRFILLPDGRRQILSFYLPGDLVSLQAMHGKPLGFSVRALSPMTLCVFDREKFLSKIHENAEMRQRYEELWLLHSTRMDARLVDIGRRKAIEQIAQLIIYLERRFENIQDIKEDGSFPYLLRQEHVADALGLTRVHVNRIFSLLRQQNIISIDNDRLIIRDRDLLLKFAGEPSEGDSSGDGRHDT